MDLQEAVWLRKLADDSHDILYRYRLRSPCGFDYVSPSAESITGYGLAEHYADADLAWSMISPTSRDAFLAQMRTSAGEAAQTFRWSRKDGELIWMEHRNRLVVGLDGLPEALHGVARDVTSHRRSEIAQQLLADLGVVLASSLEIDALFGQVASLLARDMACVAVLDIELPDTEPCARMACNASVPAMVSEALARSTQRTNIQRPPPLLEAMKSRETILYNHPTDAELARLSTEAVTMEHWHTLQPQGILTVPLTCHRAYFGAITLVASPLHGPFTPWHVGTLQDVAQRVSMAADNAVQYKAAQTAIQARDTVLSIVAHDLRSPLAAAHLAAQRLIRKAGADERLTKAAQTITGSVERANHLIQDLLDVAQLEAKSLAVECVPEAPEALIQQAATDFEPLISQASLHLKTDGALTLPKVEADKLRVAQIYSNLIANAIKFTPADGTIELGARPEKAEVRFWIRDTGPGIPPEDLPHVFDRFWQAKRTRASGAGLGLAIVKGLVEAHHGRVWVESQVGMGTTFSFTLPRAT